MRNWKLITCVILCISVLIFSMILYSVWTSVQSEQQLRYPGGNDRRWKSGSKSWTEESDRKDVGTSSPSSSGSSSLPGSSDSHREGSLPTNTVRDYTTPFKLPPTHEDEELWFDEIMKFNRLKPGGQQNQQQPGGDRSSHTKEDRNATDRQRFHVDSGNFRVHMASVWDPHPSYKLYAFGREWRIDLVPSNPVVVPTFQVTEHHENGNESKRIYGGTGNSNASGEILSQGCFYTGEVAGDDKSSVSVSLCHGMTGHIRTSEGSYFIEPVGDWKGPHEPLQHIIYKVPSLPKGVDDDIAGAGVHLNSDPVTSLELEKQQSNHHQRTKRSMSKERHVELMVTADSTMVAYHGANLRHYILTLLHIVALVFRDASIGNPINIALVNLHILKTRDFARKQTSHNASGLSASDMLRNFCKWQRDMNDPDDNARGHHDTALLLTRQTICRNPWLGKCGTLGLAELGTMCDHFASCALVQDNGLSAAFTIAHELGHVMNMPHDDDSKCQSFSQDTGGLGIKAMAAAAAGTGRYNANVSSSSIGAGGEHYVMSRMLDHNTYPWAWSKCSRHYLTEFLDAGNGYCLEDKPIAENLIMDTTTSRTQSKQPGEIFNEHKQCQLVYGNESRLCSYMPSCRRLWCTHGGETDGEGCRTQHMPWADGTPCGDSKWCLKGACVLKDLETLRIVDGGWGSWGDYGDCSRECGGGVRRSTRECDNPRPSNGGKYCTGPRVRYESCNTFECEGDVKDFRAEQCAAFNNNNMKIQGLPTDVQWVPKYSGISTKDRCKLFCRVMGSSAYYLLKEKAIDGTPCGPDKFDICVNGACMPAGCDRRLYSKKQLDFCGVCGGDGHTCHTESGFYNKSSYGYSSVIRIPAGASSIDIRQVSSASRDDNYLALIDPRTNEYLLNGDFVVSMFHKTVHASGTLLEYSGSDTNNERINSSRPLQSDLILQVLSVGKLTGPSIYYQFVINKGGHSHGAGPPYKVSSSSSSSSSAKWTEVGPPVVRPQPSGTFTWRINSFTCSSDCYGLAIPRYDCYRGENMVPPHYCNHMTYPTMKGKYCNTHCKFLWKVFTKSECVFREGQCGSGYRVLTHRCAMEYTNGTGGFMKDDRKCEEAKQDRPEDGRELCEVPCEKAVWKHGAWGDCDAICGDGWQLRSAACTMKNQIVEPHLCGNFSKHNLEYGEGEGIVVGENSKKLTVRRKCNERDCGEWKIDTWSPCSKTCGEGYSMAAYACYLKNQILPPNYCLKSPRPPTQRKCDLPPCHHWVLGPYKCDHCGLNVTRKIKCVTFSTGQDADPSQCDPSEKPGKTQVYCGDCQLPARARLVSHDQREQGQVQSISSLSYGEWIAAEWGKCISTELGYKRIRLVQCTQLLCNSESKPATIDECGIWSTGKWSDCDTSCGAGQEFRSVTCNVLGKPTSDLELCPQPMPNESRECAKVSSCEWKIGPWSKCSKICGGGKRLRQIVCEGRHCIEESKPVTMEDCNVEPCPVWLNGDWSECSSTCGGGVKERSVKCVDWDYHSVPEAKCSGMTKPAMVEKCGEAECGESNSVDDTFTYRWDVGHWSNCTKKCGKGNKVREVYCSRVKYSTGRVVSKHKVPDAYCRSQKPRDKRGCSRFSCTVKWVIGQWSDCSRECGFGLQERSVSCHRANRYGWTDPDPVHGCNTDERPPPYQYCNLGECNGSYRWKTEAWTPCTAPCEILLRQKRRVYCFDVKKQVRVNASHCKDTKKPQRKRKCPVTPCGRTSCAGLPNGNTILNVAGRNVTIHCHNGKEYINVKPEDNYSEMYEKRLTRPETCPKDGARLDTCECIVERSRKSGFTYFDKVRLNVTNLRVQGDDFEFARLQSGNHINYGEAGDCYSSANCPQGKFSINLNGTGFVVSPETEWGSTGHRASIWVHKSKDRNIITGKCGGYCGSCQPLRPTGIKLQVL